VPPVRSASVVPIAKVVRALGEDSRALQSVTVIIESPGCRCAIDEDGRGGREVRLFWKPDFKVAIVNGNSLQLN
jgi:hypothetical protein